MSLIVASTVDVRDMLCAQAIMVVWRACRTLAAEAVLEIVCNAHDVKDDLLIWAKELRYSVLEVEDRSPNTWLRIRKGT